MVEESKHAIEHHIRMSAERAITHALYDDAHPSVSQLINSAKDKIVLHEFRDPGVLPIALEHAAGQLLRAAVWLRRQSG